MEPALSKTSFEKTFTGEPDELLSSKEAKLDDTSTSVSSDTSSDSSLDSVSDFEVDGNSNLDKDENAENEIESNEKDNTSETETSNATHSTDNLIRTLEDDISTPLRNFVIDETQTEKCRENHCVVIIVGTENNFIVKKDYQSLETTLRKLVVLPCGEIVIRSHENNADAFRLRSIPVCASSCGARNLENLTNADWWFEDFVSFDDISIAQSFVRRYIENLKINYSPSGLCACALTNSLTDVVESENATAASEDGKPVRKRKRLSPTRIPLISVETWAASIERNFKCYQNFHESVWKAALNFSSNQQLCALTLALTGKILNVDTNVDKIILRDDILSEVLGAKGETYDERFRSVILALSRGRFRYSYETVDDKPAKIPKTKTENDRPKRRKRDVVVDKPDSKKPLNVITLKLKSKRRRFVVMERNVFYDFAQMYSPLIRRTFRLLSDLRNVYDKL